MELLLSLSRVNHFGRDFGSVWKVGNAPENDYSGNKKNFKRTNHSWTNSIAGFAVSRAPSSGDFVQNTQSGRLGLLYRKPLAYLKKNLTKRPLSSPCRIANPSNFSSSDQNPGPFPTTILLDPPPPLSLTVDRSWQKTSSRRPAKKKALLPPHTRHFVDNAASAYRGNIGR